MILRRLLTVVVLAVVFVAMTSTASATAPSSRNNQDFNPYSTPNIGASLCYGASLDFSRASAARCAAQAHANSSEHETPVAPSYQYAALGDSIAAGAGLPGSPDSDDAACGRSTQAYSYHIAAARGLDFIHVACSGATMSNLTTTQLGVSGLNPVAQLDNAFAGGTPDLITITAGANDVRWDILLRKCLRNTCGTAKDTKSVQTALAELQAETQTVLQQIARHSDGSPPKVILTGYYNPISQSCINTQRRVTNEEIAWVTSQLANLNQTLQNAVAGSTFATFVPINFSGHDLCSSDPWVQGLNDPAPLHPTVTGQQVIAETILKNL